METQVTGKFSDGIETSPDVDLFRYLFDIKI